MEDDNREGMSEMDKLVGEKVANELKKLDASVQDNHKQLHDIVARQEKEMKELGGVTTATNAALKKAEQRYDQQVAELKGLHSELTGRIQELAEAQADIEEERKELLQRRAAANQSRGQKNIKDAFDNDMWKNWNPRSRTDSPVIELGRLDDWKVKGVKSLHRKDITGGASLDAVLGITNWQEIYGEPVNERVHLRSYMNIESADGASVSFVRRTGFDNNAAFQGTPGTMKPQSDHTFEDFNAPACVLAHHSTISKQQARSTSSVVSFVQNELLNGLYHAESRQLLFGDGTSGNITGIANTTGVQPYVRGKVSDTMIDALRRSETQLEAIYMMGDLFVVNHEDWENIELMKDGESRYLWVSVQNGGTPRMWRKPVFVTPAMSQGDFLNGDFSSSATMLDFEQATVQMFSQHADYAPRNLLLTLAEETIGLAVTVPAGFVMGNYTSVGSGSGYVAP